MKMLTQIEVVDIENLKHIPKIKFCGYTECFKDANEIRARERLKELLTK